MSDKGAFRFSRVADLGNGDLLNQVAALTNRSPAELRYLLTGPAHPLSRAFCIEDSEGRLVGFQGFVHKKLRNGDQTVNGFRSEFTIALPELRGTGVYGNFYRWTVQQLREEWGATATYVFGETAHRAWLTYGFKIIKRYTFHQLLAPQGRAEGRFASTINSHIYRMTAKALRVIAFPLLWHRPHRVEMSTTLSLADYERASSLARPRRWRLEFDGQTLRARYEDNPFYEYEFWSTKDSLLIVKRTNAGCEIADILCRTWRGYRDVIEVLTKQYAQVELHGNVRSEARAPYLWINVAFGALPLVGGGSYVENKDTARGVALRDLPLYEAYHFGTPGG